MASKIHEWIDQDGRVFPEKETLIVGWLRNGLSDKQVAENMGISRSTLNVWRKKHLQLDELFKESKTIADMNVVNSLYQRANGYKIPVLRHIKVKKVYYDEMGRKCENEEIKEVYDEVHIPGDTTAEIFWLKNRLPETWRSKPEPQVPEDERGVVEIPRVNNFKEN